MNLVEEQVAYDLTNDEFLDTNEGECDLMTPASSPVGPATKRAALATARDLVDPAILKPGCIDDKNMLGRLFAAGFTHDEIACHFGVSRVAVTKMISKMDLHRETTNPAIFQEKMQDEILRRMEVLLKYMSPEKMNKASLSQIIMAFGTLYDKMRLHRGESTQNVASLNVHKISTQDIDKIREIIHKHTESKLEKVRKEYEDEQEV